MVEPTAVLFYNGVTTSNLKGTTMADAILKKLAETASNPAAVGADAVRATFAEHFGALPKLDQGALMAAISGGFLLEAIISDLDERAKSKGGKIDSSTAIATTVKVAKEVAVLGVQTALEGSIKAKLGKRP